MFFVFFTYHISSQAWSSLTPIEAKFDVAEVIPQLWGSFNNNNKKIAQYILKWVNLKIKLFFKDFVCLEWVIVVWIIVLWCDFYSLGTFNSLSLGLASCHKKKVKNLLIKMIPWDVKVHKVDETYMIGPKGTAKGRNSLRKCILKYHCTGNGQRSFHMHPACKAIIIVFCNVLRLSRSVCLCM